MIPTSASEMFAAFIGNWKYQWTDESYEERYMWFQDNFSTLGGHANQKRRLNFSHKKNKDGRKVEYITEEQSVRNTFRSSILDKVYGDHRKS